MNPLAKLTGRFDFTTALLWVVALILIFLVGVVVFSEVNKEDCQPPKQIVNQCYYRIYTGKVWINYDVHCMDTRAQHVRQVCK